MAYDAQVYRPDYRMHSGGLVNSELPETLNSDQSPDLLNVRPLGFGRYGSRNGVELLGDEITDPGSISSLYTFVKLSEEILLRARETVLEFLDDDAWEQIPGATGYTDNLKFGFANDHRYIYGGNGVDAFLQWDGRNLGPEEFTADAGADVITSAGHGLSNGAMVVLTTTDTLPAGLSTDTVYFVINATTDTFKLSATAGGSAIDITDTGTGTHSWASSIKTYSGNPKGNIFCFHVRRLLVAGDPANPATLHYSKTGNAVDFTFSTPRQADDGGSVIIGEGGDAITSIKSLITPDGSSSAIVFKKSSRVFAVTFSTDGVPAIKELKRETGAVSDRATIIFENDILYVDESNNVQSLGFVQSIQNSLQKEQASNNLDGETPDLDFEDGCAVYFRKQKFAIFCGKSFGSAYNDICFAYYTKYKSWWRWNGINANQFAIYQGRLVWASSYNQNVYRLSNGYDDLGQPILTYRDTKDIDLTDIKDEVGNGIAGVGMKYKQTRFIFIEGFMSPNSLLKVRHIFEANPEAYVEKELSGTGDFVDQDVFLTFGRKVFGFDAFGGYAKTPSAFPMQHFIARISLDAYSYLKARIRIEQSKTGAPYVITRIMPWMSLEPDEKFEDSKKV